MSDLRIIFLALTLITPAFLAAQAEEEYLIVRQDEKITLYERWINFPGTTINSRQIKSVFITTATLDKMFVALTDETKIKEWQSYIIEYRHIPKNDSLWYAYSLYDIPWPLTNQDYLLSYSLKERTENRVVLSFQHSADEKLAPLREDVDRTPTIGQWELVKIANDKIQVTYTATSIPVSYPRFVTDRIVRNNFMSTLHTLIEVAEKN